MSRVAEMGVTNAIIAAYVDDIFFAAASWADMIIIKNACDALALELGVSFNPEKD
jgi:hypothetical protein